MKPTENPNIFDYATSELSQDAFICYMLNFPPAAKLFLEKCKIENENILDIEHQHKHIDILVKTDNHYLIIEDKTGTGEHDDQINRYCDATLKNKNLDKNKSIHVCYVKTDYLSDQEEKDIKKRMKEKHPNIPVSVICLGDLLECVKKFSSNPIAKQWNELFEKKWKHIQNELKKDLNFKTQNNLRIYLDRLTAKIKNETGNLYQDAWWFIAGYGTPHIELAWSERKKVTVNHWGQQSIFLMFRKKGLKLVVKYHFFDAQDKGERIKIRDYSAVDIEKLEEVRKNISKVEGWTPVKVKENKERLMLIQKDVEEADLIETLKNEKEHIEKFFSLIN